MSIIHFTGLKLKWGGRNRIWGGGGGVQSVPGPGVQSQLIYPWLSYGC